MDVSTTSAMMMAIGRAKRDAKFGSSGGVSYKHARLRSPSSSFSPSRETTIGRRGRPCADGWMARPISHSSSGDSPLNRRDRSRRRTNQMSRKRVICTKVSVRSGTTRCGRACESALNSSLRRGLGFLCTLAVSLCGPVAVAAWLSLCSMYAS